MMLNMFIAMHYTMVLLMYLWTALSGTEAVAVVPRYCGRRGSGVDELSAPTEGGDLDLVQIQVVTRHGARTPTADCRRWLPGARELALARRYAIAHSGEHTMVVGGELAKTPIFVFAGGRDEAAADLVEPDQRGRSG